MNQNCWKWQQTCGIDILGLFDHKITHEEDIKYQQIDQHLIITSSAWRNSRNAAVGGVGGVGLIISKKTEDTLSEVIEQIDRILIAHFNGNPVTTLIMHYAPCEGHHCHG